MSQHHQSSSGSHHPSSVAGGGGGSSSAISAASQAMMMAGGGMAHLAGAGGSAVLSGSELKPPKKPEKPQSAYMRYNKSIHEKIKADNPQLKMWDVAKIIGQMWRELPDNERQVLNEEYEIDKARYNEELKAYYNSPAYQTYLQLKNREKQLQEQHNASQSADSRSLLNESKMTITPAIDDEDLDEDGFGLKHLAAARYRRNNRLILDVFSDFHVNPRDTSQTIVTVDRLKALQSQVDSLIEHENERIDELVEMEKKHEERKRKMEESREKFEAEWDRLSAKRFNWMTTTEAELKEIKAWFKQTYGMDTGSTTSADTTEDTSASNEEKGEAAEDEQQQCPQQQPEQTMSDDNSKLGEEDSRTDVDNKNTPPELISQEDQADSNSNTAAVDASNTVEQTQTSNTVEQTSNTVEHTSNTVEDTSNTSEQTSNAVEQASNVVERNSNTVEQDSAYETLTVSDSQSHSAMKIEQQWGSDCETKSSDHDHEVQEETSDTKSEDAVKEVKEEKTPAKDDSRQEENTEQWAQQHCEAEEPQTLQDPSDPIEDTSIESSESTSELAESTVTIEANDFRRESVTEEEPPVISISETKECEEKGDAASTGPKTPEIINEKSVPLEVSLAPQQPSETGDEGTDEGDSTDVAPTSEEDEEPQRQSSEGSSTTEHADA
ncbi:SWI/SNF-related matrix-associated actin-dependent regulator of chromatin subfamily E member 1-like isoform X2 [Symsagittifera roscoffensis]